MIPKRLEVWRSSFLAQEVRVARWGDAGAPVLLFPTAGGDAEEIERHRMIQALAPLLEAGRVQIFSCDSVPGRCWVSQEFDAGQSYNGLIVYESPDTTMIQTGPDTVVRLTGVRKDGMRKSNLSLMPTGLLNEAKDQDIADLYEYLKTLKK